MTISIQEFYQKYIVDPDFDEIKYLDQNPDVKDFYQPICQQEGIDDKHRLFYHYSIYINPSKDIISFYQNNEIDENFDHNFYLEQSPKAWNFCKSFCSRNGIQEKERLFYHYKFYGDKTKSNLDNFLNLPKNNPLNISTIKDIEKLSIDRLLPPSDMYIDQYHDYINMGKNIAKTSKIAVVSLARNCDKYLQNSIDTINSIVCKKFSMFIFENDSIDNTKQILVDLKKSNTNIVVQLSNNNRPYLQDRSKERTSALAEYRNACLDFVKKRCKKYDYIIVLDLDANLGFSVDGIYNSIGWFDVLKNVGGIASYSLALKIFRDEGILAHYDSFASRLNDWKPTSEDCDQNNIWFRNLHPIIGSQPFHLRSCFGGLAIYRTKAFLSGRYSAELGSEHVKFHQDLYNNGYKMYLNPSSRFFSVYENYFNE